LSGRAKHFVSFSIETGRRYELCRYCPQAGRFAAVFRNISKHVRLEQQLCREHELNQKARSNAGLRGLFRNDCLQWCHHSLVHALQHFHAVRFEHGAVAHVIASLPDEADDTKQDMNEREAVTEPGFDQAYGIPSVFI